MAIKILALDGLNDAKLCDLTAQLLETLPGVDSAKIEFMSQKLTLQISGRDENETLGEVVSTLERTIPGISVSRTDMGANQTKEAQTARGRRDGEEEEAGLRPRSPAQEETKKKKGHVSADAILYLIGLVLAAGVFFVSFAFEDNEALSRLLCGAALVIASLFSLFFKWSRRRSGYRAVTLLYIALSGALFYLGYIRQSAGAVMLYLAGALAVSMLSDRFDAAVAGLVDICPHTVVRLRDGQLEQVPPEQVEPGDRVLLRTGDVLPFDGTVVESAARLDCSLFSGDREPVEVKSGYGVRCGDRILRGPLTIEVSAPQKSTAAWRLRQSLTTDPPRTQTEKQVRKWALLCSILVLIVAGVAAYLRYDPLEAEIWLYPLFTILILAIPGGAGAFGGSAQRGGMARALREGILMRSGETLEKVSHLKTGALNYTGTVTLGEYQVSRVAPVSAMPAERVVELAAAAEYGVVHPMADAVLDYFEKTTKQKAQDQKWVKGEHTPGMGARTMVDRRVIMAGSALYMAEAGIETPKNETGKSCIYVAERGEYIGMLVLDDPPNPGAKSLSDALHALGVEKTSILTACDEEVGLAAQETLGFDEVFSEKTREGKRETLQALSARGPVLFAGGIDEVDLFDTVNVGVVMGAQSVGPALSCSGAVIPSGELGAVAKLIRIGKSVQSTLMVNLVVSAVVKAVCACAVLFWPVPFYAAAAVNAACAVWVAFFTARTFASGEET